MLDILFDLLVEMVPLAFRKRFPRNQEWTGVVEERTKRSDWLLSKNNTLIKFRKEDGSFAKLAVRESAAAGYDIGRRYRKSRGNSIPQPI